MAPVSWFVPWVAKVTGIVTLPDTCCDPIVPANLGRYVPMPPSLPYVPMMVEPLFGAWHDASLTLNETPPRVPLTVVRGTAGNGKTAVPGRERVDSKIRKPTQTVTRAAYCG